MNTSPQSGRIPGAEHYREGYVSAGRIFSFAHQTAAALAFKPGTLLEVGVGTGMVAAMLRTAGVRVSTLDIQPELKPDLLGSILDIPAAAGRFNVALCCQVLEHLPFEQFSPALRELRRVTTSGLVVSLPDVTRLIYLAYNLPKIGRRSFTWPCPRLRDPAMPASRMEKMGHFWEIGFRGYPLKRVMNSMVAAGWTVERTWRVPENPWHRFFRLVPAEAGGSSSPT